MPVKSGRENFAGPMKLSVSWLFVTLQCGKTQLFSIHLFFFKELSHEADCNHVSYKHAYLVACVQPADRNSPAALSLSNI